MNSDEHATMCGHEDSFGGQCPPPPSARSGQCPCFSNACSRLPDPQAPRGSPLHFPSPHRCTKITDILSMHPAFLWVLGIWTEILTCAVSVCTHQVISHTRYNTVFSTDLIQKHLSTTRKTNVNKNNSSPRGSCATSSCTIDWYMPLRNRKREKKINRHTYNPVLKKQELCCKFKARLGSRGQSSLKNKNQKGNHNLITIHCVNMMTQYCSAWSICL